MNSNTVEPTIRTQPTEAPPVPNPRKEALVRLDAMRAELLAHVGQYDDATDANITGAYYLLERGIEKLARGSK